MTTVRYPGITELSRWQAADAKWELLETPATFLPQRFLQHCRQG